MSSGRRRLMGSLLLLGLVLAAGLFFGYRAAARPFGQGVGEDGSQELYRTTTVGQTFVAPFDKLSRVDIYLSPRGQANTAYVILHLRTAPDAAGDLRSSVVNAATVTSDSWVRFDFAPIPDSQGKRYYLLLESPSSTPDNALGVFRSRQDRYRDGVYYLNGTPADGDLAFQIYSQPGLLSWLRGLGSLLAEDKPFVWGMPGFYGLLLTGYVILLAAVVAFLAGRDAGEDIP